MQRTNETAQRVGRELLSKLFSTIVTVALIAITAMQVPDVLIWLAK
ncbi:hypothetical protein [Pseudomonas fluorescens]|nr:hypothetical protein [Pseudomonas fluorescens]